MHGLFRRLGTVLAPALAALAAPLAAAGVAGGCGTSSTETPSSTGSGAGGGAFDAGIVTLHPDAEPLPGESECVVTIQTGIEVVDHTHLPFCTPIEYPTNPPSGGNHWGFWAAYKEYSVPVHREMYVHDMEHGGVVLAYRCAQDCPDVVAAIEHVAGAVPADPECLMQPVPILSRLVITPDPELATPIAAAAWGATYVATCIDEDSLAKFVAQVYGHGREDTCARGRDIEDPEAGLPDCDAGVDGEAGVADDHDAG